MRLKPLDNAKVTCMYKYIVKFYVLNGSYQCGERTKTYIVCETIFYFWF